MIEIADSKRILAEFKIPVVVGIGLGICRVAHMDGKHPILGLAKDSLLPTDAELRMIQSFQEHVIRRWYTPEWQEKLLAMPYPVDQGSNTILFLSGFREEPGVWGFRRISWDTGPTWVVGTGKDMAKRFRSPLDVMLYETKNDGGRFKKWREAHPDLFTEKAHV